MAERDQLEVNLDRIRNALKRERTSDTTPSDERPFLQVTRAPDAPAPVATATASDRPSLIERLMFWRRR